MAEKFVWDENINKFYLKNSNKTTNKENDEETGSTVKKRRHGDGYVEKNKDEYNSREQTTFGYGQCYGASPRSDTWRIVPRN